MAKNRRAKRRSAAPADRSDPSPALPRSQTTPALLISAVDAESLSSNPTSAFAADPNATIMTQPHSASAISPTPTASTSSKAQKKGHSFLNVFKSKERSDASQRSFTPPPAPDVVLSPKAAKVLGLPVHRTFTTKDDNEESESSSSSELCDLDSDNGVNPPTLKKKRSLLDILTSKQSSDGTGARAISPYNEPETLQRGAHGKTRMHMFDRISLFSRNNRSGQKAEVTQSPISQASFEGDNLLGDIDLVAEGSVEPQTSASKKKKNRRRKKKSKRKLGDKMPSITEEGPSGQSEPTAPSSDLSDPSLSTVEGSKAVINETRSNLETFVRSGDARDTLAELDRHTQDMMKLNSQLEKMHEMLLKGHSGNMDQLARQLEEMKTTLDKNDETRRVMNDDVTQMKKVHEGNKHGLICACCVPKYVAERMTVTPITPGMVNLVDIPPRRIANTNTATASLIDVPPRRIGNTNTATASPISPSSVYTQGASRRQGVFDSSIPRFENDDLIRTPQGSEFQSSQRTMPKEKKSRLPREESRTMIEDWITDSGPAAERPFSQRLDPDVLADQSLDRAPPVPPKNVSRSSNNVCYNNGHIFRPKANVSTVEGATDDPDISPYLQPQIRVRVACGRCGEEIKEDGWKCVVCGFVACNPCKTPMVKEWQAKFAHDCELRGLLPRKG